MRRVPASTIWSGLWLAGIAIRVLAVAALVLGPWTDDPGRLQGWDAERFQQIADRDEAAWVDQPIEYPPGSVLIFDAIAGADVVATNRTLVVLSALCEVLAVGLLWRRFGARVGQGYLILGLPLVPMGLLRLDLAVTTVAIAAAVALVGNHDAEGSPRFQAAGANARSVLATIPFAAPAMAGTMIKIWPALLVAGALAVGRRAAAVAAVLLTGAAGLLWLGVVGDGLEPVEQVLSLRGATGWHVESLPGALVALLGDEPARLELNAFRIGRLNTTVVTLGRVVAVAVIVALIAAGLRAGQSQSEIHRFSMVMLGSVAALLITAPLLSPQFLLWLTPWGAMLFASPDRTVASVTAESEAAGSVDAAAPGGSWTIVLGLVAAAVVLTGFTLTIFGPDGVAATVPALLLTIRNGALATLPIAALFQLWNGAGSDLADHRGEDPLWDGGTGPHP